DFCKNSVSDSRLASMPELSISANQNQHARGDFSMDKLKAGEAAPNFTTTTDEGKTVKLSDYRGKRVVLYFYPKDDTPGCTTQACSFRDLYPSVQAKNAVVVGVSPDDVASHQQFRSKYELPFELVIDPEHKVAEEFGVWRERERDGQKFMGILRSHFVIDESGKVVQVEYNVAPAESAQKAMAALG